MSQARAEKMPLESRKKREAERTIIKTLRQRGETCRNARKMAVIMQLQLSTDGESSIQK